MTLPHLFTSSSAVPTGAAIVAVALSFGPQRQLIEQSMVWHMVIQMPMLVLSGWLWAREFFRLRPDSLTSQWNRYGLTGFIGVQVAVSYWMLPTTIDRAIVLTEVDLFKLVTLLICGATLKQSFGRAPLTVQLFFVGVTVSMMAWLGLYFITTNLRLCNVYSLQSQVDAGYGLLALSAGIGATWLWAAFRQTAQPSSKCSN